MVTVRFYVGQNCEASWVKLHNKIAANIDQIPPGVTGWVVKPVEIDDVPIVNLTLYSDRYSDYELRRMAEELEIRLQSVKNTGRTYVAVENIHRHFAMRLLDPYRAVLKAVNEVRPPVILATLTVIISFLPMFFDNKNELQVVINMPEGTPLETTEAAANGFARYLVRVPEVTDVTTYVGLSSPVDFSGLIRRYYLRQGGHVADARFNLAGKKLRAQQSHAMALRLRPDLEALARQYGAAIRVLEMPPGPPVIATLTAEVYGKEGQSHAQMIEAAARVRHLMEQTPGVVDIDDVSVAPQTKVVFEVDRAKATLHGISAQQIASVLGAAGAGAPVSSLRKDEEVNPLRIVLQLPRPQRSRTTRLEQFTVRGMTGEAVLLAELGHFTETSIDQPIYHKNLKPVVYVFGDTAGLPPGEAILTLGSKVRHEPALAG